MRCIGRNKGLSHRCKNQGNPIFCHTHKFQWLYLFTAIGILWSLIQVYDRFTKDEKQPFLSSLNIQDQRKSVLELNNVLNNKKYTIEILFKDIKNNVCFNTESMDKGGDFYIYFSIYSLADCYKALFNGMYLYEARNKSIILRSREDVIVTDTFEDNGQEFFMLNMKEKRSHCNFDSRNQMFVTDYNLISDISKYYEDIYMPDAIKQELHFFYNFSYDTTSLGKCSIENNHFFILSVAGAPEYSKTKKVYSITYNGDKISFHDFLVRVEKLHLSIQNWLLDNSIE